MQAFMKTDTFLIGGESIISTAVSAVPVLLLILLVIQAVRHEILDQDNGEGKARQGKAEA